MINAGLGSFPRHGLYWCSLAYCHELTKHSRRPWMGYEKAWTCHIILGDDCYRLSSLGNWFVMKINDCWCFKPLGLGCLLQSSSSPARVPYEVQDIPLSFLSSFYRRLILLFHPFHSTSHQTLYDHRTEQKMINFIYPRGKTQPPKLLLL